MFTERTTVEDEKRWHLSSLDAVNAPFKLIHFGLKRILDYTQ